MDRRKFIQDGCKLCLAAGGVSVLAAMLDACTPLPVYKTTSENKLIKVPLDQFKENRYLIVKPSDCYYDITIIKKTNGEYQSIVMQCTHADNRLIFNGSEFQCSLHGSSFNENGDVQKGPAEKPLIKLKTTIENNHLLIQSI